MTPLQYCVAVDADSGSPVPPAGRPHDAQKPRSMARLAWASVCALGGIRTPNLLIRSLSAAVSDRLRQPSSRSAVVFPRLRGLTPARPVAVTAAVSSSSRSRLLVCRPTSSPGFESWRSGTTALSLATPQRRLPKTAASGARGDGTGPTEGGSASFAGDAVIVAVQVVTVARRDPTVVHAVPGRAPDEGGHRAP